MKDFLGRELNVGDHVIHMHPLGFKRFKLGKIDRFTEKGNDAYVLWGKNGVNEKRQHGNQLVKVEGPDLTWFFLNQD